MLPFDIQRRREPSAEVVTVRGELDMRASAELQPVFDACVAESDCAVIADYSGVLFIDSIAIGQLITVRQRLALDLRQFMVVSQLRKVRRVLAMTGADRAIPVFDTLDEARAHVQPAVG